MHAFRLLCIKSRGNYNVRRSRPMIAPNPKVEQLSSMCNHQYGCHPNPKVEQLSSMCNHQYGCHLIVWTQGSKRDLIPPLGFRGFTTLRLKNGPDIVERLYSASLNQFTFSKFKMYCFMVTLVGKDSFLWPNFVKYLHFSNKYKTGESQYKGVGGTQIWFGWGCATKAWNPYSFLRVIFWGGKVPLKGFFLKSRSIFPKFWKNRPMFRDIFVEMGRFGPISRNCEKMTH